MGVGVIEVLFVAVGVVTAVVGASTAATTSTATMVGSGVGTGSATVVNVGFRSGTTHTSDVTTFATITARFDMCLASRSTGTATTTTTATSMSVAASTTMAAG